MDLIDLLLILAHQKYNMNLENLQYKLESITLPAIICKSLILFKVSLIKIIDFLNDLNPFPAFTNIVSSGGLEEKYLIDKKNFTFAEDSKMYVAGGTKEDPDIGDMCLWNGMYSAYNTKFEDNSFFEKYYKFFLRKNKNGKWHLLRGADKNNLRTDVSGDQLTGFVLACQENKKKMGYLPLPVKDFFKELSCDFKLKDEDNNPTRFGMFNPNLITINGSCSVILAALAVSEQWDKFDYLYNKCGYKYMLKHASIYLWDEGKGPKVFGYQFSGDRSWFSCNIAIISLGIIYDELMIRGNIKQANYVKKCILKILNRNTYNTFFWAYIQDKGIPVNIPEEAKNFFNTFSNAIDCYPFISLANQNSDWIWQRNPYEKQDGGYNRLDFVYTYDLLKNYK